MRRRNLSIRTIGRSVPWETIIPATFFGASAVCWCDPQCAPSVAFLLIGFGTLFFDSVAAYFTQPAARGLSLAITDSLTTFADDSNSEQTDKLLSALAASIGRALRSNALISTLKRSTLESLRDDDLQRAAIDTLQGALIKATENEGFRETAMNVTKSAFIGALSNDELVRELMTSIVGAIVLASQDKVLTRTMLDIVNQAVSEALADERFVSELRGAVKDTLSDGNIYRAGARGVLSAAFGRESNDGKSKSDSVITRGNSDTTNSTSA